MDPGCPQASYCPGCRLRHTRYPEQLEWFQSRLERILDREIGAERPRVEPVQPHPQQEGYRIRTTVRVFAAEERIILGMAAKAGRLEPVDLTKCSNHDPRLNRLLRSIRDVLDDAGPEIVSELIRWIAVHLSADGRDRITAVTGSIRNFQRAGLDRRLADRFPDHSVHLFESAEPSEKTSGPDPVIVSGRPEILFPVAGMELAVLPGAWTPVSYGTADRLDRTVLDILQETGGSSVIEIGCGFGGSAFFLARNGIRIIGIDRDRAAVRSAGMNRDRLRVANPVFITGKGDHCLRRLLRSRERYDAVILHGMRKGFGERLLDMLTVTGARQIILISPGTGAFVRNTVQLIDRGWFPDRFILQDQIPHTTSVLSTGVFRKGERSR